MPARPRGTLRPGDARAGAAAGVVATIAMSGLMLAAQRLGFQAKLPPERVVQAGLDTAGVRRSERTDNALASVAHLAYGALLGIAYRWLRRATGAPGPEPVAGAAYGLGVYVANYAGALPPLGIMPWPHRDVRGRQATMAFAHLLYGLVLGARSRDLRRDASPPAGASPPGVT